MTKQDKTKPTLLDTRARRALLIILLLQVRLEMKVIISTTRPFFDIFDIRVLD